MSWNDEGGVRGAFGKAPPMKMRAAVAASLAGLLFGFDTAVISGVTDALEVVFHLSPEGLGMAVSSALWGTLAGATVAGRLGDALGSRRMLLWIGGLYLVSALGSAWSSDLEFFVLFRVLGGLAIGASSVLAPVYISEISPPERRGHLVGMFQFNVVAGILVAYFSNALMAAAVPGDWAWRAKLAVAALPALIFTLVMPTVPDSPKWLRNKGRGAEAEKAERRLGLPLVDQLEDEVHLSGGHRLNWQMHKRPILLALAMGTFNQLSGINAILYYLNDIFASAGFTRVSSNMQAVVIGVANLLATMGGMVLIDRVGRRPLLILGGVGTGAALGGVAAIYATGQGAAWLLPLLIGFISFFALSQGAVIWVYLSEIFPTGVRARGQALGSTTHWVLNALISFAFPIIAVRTRVMPFAFFSVAMMVQALVVWRWFPETRGRDLDR